MKKKRIRVQRIVTKRIGSRGAVVGENRWEKAGKGNGNNGIGATLEGVLNKRDTIGKNFSEEKG